MKNKLKYIPIGLICGWLIAVLLGRIAPDEPASRTRILEIRIQDEINSMSIMSDRDKIGTRILTINDELKNEKNPYTFVLIQKETGKFVTASPKFESMYIYNAWERILLLNFSKYTYPVFTKEIQN